MFMVYLNTHDQRQLHRSHHEGPVRSLIECLTVPYFSELILSNETSPGLWKIVFSRMPRNCQILKPSLSTTRWVEFSSRIWPRVNKKDFVLGIRVNCESLWEVFRNCRHCKWLTLSRAFFFVSSSIQSLFCSVWRKMALMLAIRSRIYSHTQAL